MRATKKMTTCNDEEFDHELRRGPWTLEEDNLLIHYINCHGEGRWNSLAKSSGLKRTGKSCRLRWLNYLKPDIKRGNLTPQEQLLILELHSKWGNRWSKIAQNLPGRTDNEIKNYWRTRVQKQARHLKIDSNSKRFVEVIRRFWMPRLLEKVNQSSSSSSSFTSTLSPLPQSKETLITVSSSTQPTMMDSFNSSSSFCSSDSMEMVLPQMLEDSKPQTNPNEDTSYYNSILHNNDCYYVDMTNFDMIGFNQSYMGSVGSDDMSALDFQLAESDWMKDDLATNTFWNMDEWCQLRK